MDEFKKILDYDEVPQWKISVENITLDENDKLVVSILISRE